MVPSITLILENGREDQTNSSNDVMEKDIGSKICKKSEWAGHIWSADNSTVNTDDTGKQFERGKTACKIKTTVIKCS